MSKILLAEALPEMILELLPGQWKRLAFKTVEQMGERSCFGLVQ